jgi:hypothetical protein
MSKYLIVLFFFLGAIPRGFSQSNMSDYSFVIVPERFAFLNEDDKYQLNSIAEFLFNKHGFHAFKSGNAPNARRCDGLYADVVNVTAFLKTKLVLILRDCNGFEVYRSLEGVTKLKEFKQAHQDALRRTFEYFEGMGVKQKEIVYFEDEAATEIITSKQTVVENTQITNQSKDAMISVSVMNLNLPQARFSSYSKDDGAYMLRKTAEGYALYQETTKTGDGLMLVGKIEVSDDETKLSFTDTNDLVFTASFDALENLVIQKDDTSIVYIRMR